MRRFLPVAVSAVLALGLVAVSGAAVDDPTLDRIDRNVLALCAQAGVECESGTTTTAPTTTTTAGTTTTDTTLPPTTTTTAAPTTTTTAATTTTTAPPAACVGVQVAAGSNLVVVANAHPAGATFCLAAGLYNLAGTSGMPLQSGDSVIGALGSDGARLSILNGGDSVRRALTCTCSDLLIANIVIEHFDDGLEKTQPIGPSMVDTVWDNVESRFNGGRGAYTWDGNVIRNSYIHHNGELGIAGSGDNVLIENNEVAHNNYLGQMEPGREAGGSKWTNAVNVTVTGNHFHNNCGASIWFDGSGNAGILIENNLSEDNWGAGIFVELGNTTVVRNNEVYRNTFGSAGVICQNTPGGESTGAGNGGIRVSGSHNVEVYGNVLAGNDGGISSTQDGRKSVLDLYVHDNTVSYTVGWTGVQKTGGTTDPFSAGANNHFEANHYTTGLAKPFKWAGSDRTWDEWRSYGHDDTGTFN